jgi:hypothetical protein
MLIMQPIESHFRSIPNANHIPKPNANKYLTNMSLYIQSGMPETSAYISKAILAKKAAISMIDMLL